MAGNPCGCVHGQCVAADASCTCWDPYILGDKCDDLSTYTGTGALLQIWTCSLFSLGLALLMSVGVWRSLSCRKWTWSISNMVPLMSITCELLNAATLLVGLEARPGRLHLAQQVGYGTLSFYMSLTASGFVTVVVILRRCSNSRLPGHKPEPYAIIAMIGAVLCLGVMLTVISVLNFAMYRWALAIVAVLLMIMLQTPATVYGILMERKLREFPELNRVMLLKVRVFAKYSAALVVYSVFITLFSTWWALSLGIPGLIAAQYGRTVMIALLPVATYTMWAPEEAAVSTILSMRRWSHIPPPGAVVGQPPCEP